MIETIKNNVFNPVYDLVSSTYAKVAGYFFNRKVEKVNPQLVTKREVQIAQEKMLDLNAKIEYAQMNLKSAQARLNKARTAAPEVKAKAQRAFDKAVLELNNASKAMQDYTAELKSKHL